MFRTKSVIIPSVNILPALCPSSLLADLEIFSVLDVFRSRVLESLLSTPFSSPSSFLLLSAPGVTALCLRGEVGYCPGEHGDWIRLLHDLDLNWSTEGRRERKKFSPLRAFHVQGVLLIHCKNWAVFRVTYTHCTKTTHIGIKTSDVTTDSCARVMCTSSSV